MVQKKIFKIDQSLELEDAKAKPKNDRISVLLQKGKEYELKKK